MNGIDIFVQSSSYGEDFQTLLQVYGMRYACVVTDVSDAGLIVNNTGWIVPPNNSLKLARAIKKAINEYDTKIWKKDLVNVE